MSTSHLRVKSCGCVTYRSDVSLCSVHRQSPLERFLLGLALTLAATGVFLWWSLDLMQ